MRKATPIVFTGLLVTVMLIITVLIREPDTIPYHLDRLLHLHARKMPPSGIRGYFRRETLWWYLGSRPSLQRQTEIETEALIRLGYFEQREFSLQHRMLDAQFTEELNAACTTNQSVRTNYRAFSYDRPAGIIRATIRKDCMPICENIIAELDRKTN